MTWQPIETAPRDGTAIWLARPYSGHGTGQMEPARAGRREWENIYSGTSLNWQPTRWMPLPSPPASVDRNPEGQDPAEGLGAEHESAVGATGDETPNPSSQSHTERKRA